MAADTLDKIYIRDLQFRCLIGINPEERREKQDVIVNITLFTDLRCPGQTDRIEDTIDYKGLKKKILAMGEQSDFFLIERLAQRIADIALEPPTVRRVRVLVEKPFALRFAQSVGVEITRNRPPDAT